MVASASASGCPAAATSTSSPRSYAVLPTLTWPREIPIDGEPADVHEIVTRNAQWMASSPVPKLFVNGDPGALLTGPLREQCRRWPVQDEVTVPGLHFLPEDSAPAIAGALNAWLGRLA